MAEHLGSDFYCIDDIRPDLAVVSGREAVAQAVARRLRCARGALWYDPDYGYPLQRWIGTTEPPVGSIESGCKAEALKDDRVLAAECSVEFSPIPSLITVRFMLADADGPFPLTVLVGELTSQILLEEFNA